MATVDRARATLDDLMRTEGKAELIGGSIVEFAPSGRLPSRVALRIARSLADHCDRTGVGEAFPDGLGYAICPDASFFAGPFPADPMKFLEGPPTLAVEVRSEGDFGPAAERAIAAKRADYFEAGTQVVWDVDPEARTVTSHRADDPAHPRVFREGDVADAEPAVPGWRLQVDRLFA